jgi:hypothetical protein
MLMSIYTLFCSENIAYVEKAVERLKFGTIIIVVLFFEPEQFKLLQNVYNGY